MGAIRGHAPLLALVPLDQITDADAGFKKPLPRVLVTWQGAEYDNTHDGLSGLRLWTVDIQIHARSYAECAGVRDILVPFLDVFRADGIESMRVMNATYLPAIERDGSSEGIHQITINLESHAIQEA